ncbi:MAG: hypothetical protein AVDCRST_MAG59-721, partial [uncultured Thermomicrobiales bacterium]
CRTHPSPWLPGSTKASAWRRFDASSAPGTVSIWPAVTSSVVAPPPRRSVHASSNWSSRPTTRSGLPPAPTSIA